jgi:hypothetical protein
MLNVIFCVPCLLGEKICAWSINSFYRYASLLQKYMPLGAMKSHMKITSLKATVQHIQTMLELP